MPDSSITHAYLSWAKERIEEMNGALASFEAKASKLEGDSQVLGSQLIVELRKYRDEFRATVEKLAAANEASWVDYEEKLEDVWDRFQEQVELYVETVGKSVEQTRDTVNSVAAAQARAWKKTTAELREFANTVVSARRANVNVAISQMAAEAENAKVRLQELRQAGSESWSAFSAALDTSRKAFDKANQQAWDALQRAMHQR